MCDHPPAVHVTLPLSSSFDPARIVDPARRGAVAWGQFNESYRRFLARPWHRVNEGRRLSLGTRLARLLAALIVRTNGALEDLPGKARALAALPLPRDPDIVFFGAEAGTEALLLRALFGDRGRCTLIDVDEAGFRRFEDAPRALVIQAPRGSPARTLTLLRDPARIEYVRADLFDHEPSAPYDVGLDWGLVEHFDAAGKSRLLQRLRRFLKPGGIEVSVAPRDVWSVRLFYRLFAEELNFGHRELLTLDEHRALLEAAGFEVVHARALPGATLVAGRVGAATGG